MFGLDELRLGFAPRLIDGPLSVLANGIPAGPALGVSILNDERLRPTRFHAYAEATCFPAPYELVVLRIGLEFVHSPFGQFVGHRLPSGKLGGSRKTETYGISWHAYDRNIVLKPLIYNI